MENIGNNTAKELNKITILYNRRGGTIPGAGGYPRGESGNPARGRVTPLRTREKKKDPSWWWCFRYRRKNGNTPKALWDKGFGEWRYRCYPNSLLFPMEFSHI